MLRLCRRRVRSGEDEPSRWFVKKGKDESGPLEFRHLQNLIDFDLLAPTDLVRRRDEAGWTPIGRLPVAKRLKWPAKSAKRSRRNPAGCPDGKEGEDPSAAETGDNPGPVREKLSSVIHGGAVVVERCRVLLRGLALALISLGGYEAIHALRVFLFPIDHPLLGLGFVFVFLGLGAFWVTYDGEEKY
jgi:hypothetical protein